MGYSRPAILLHILFIEYSRADNHLKYFTMAYGRAAILPIILFMENSRSAILSNLLFIQYLNYWLKDTKFVLFQQYSRSAIPCEQNISKVQPRGQTLQIENIQRWVILKISRNICGLFANGIKSEVKIVNINLQPVTSLFFSRELGFYIWVSAAEVKEREREKEERRRTQPNLLDCICSKEHRAQQQVQVQRFFFFSAAARGIFIFILFYLKFDLTWLLHEVYWI